MNREDKLQNVQWQHYIHLLENPKLTHFHRHLSFI